MTDPQQFFSTEILPVGTRLACAIEYNGSHYHGWQAQPNLGVNTVQETLEQGLAVVATQPVRVHCAGRTDTGVHGVAQIVHFDSPVARSCKAWVLGTNANLPFDIRVHWAVPVSSDFHARFSALSRSYRYLIANTRVRPALLQGQMTWQRKSLDVPSMQAEAQCLLGEQDFSAFQAASCQSPTPMRNVSVIEVTRRGSVVVIDIQANAFLHHMVRNIAGSLMAVGTGVKKQGWIAELMAGRDRTRAAETAPPDGLYLIEVAYPPHFALPASVSGPLLLAG